MNILDDTQALFAQLGAAPGSLAVKTIIENHDAWSHSHAALPPPARITLGTLPADPARRAQILRQRQRLEPLVTRLPVRYASAS